MSYNHSHCCCLWSSWPAVSWAMYSCSLLVSPCVQFCYLLLRHHNNWTPHFHDVDPFPFFGGGGKGLAHCHRAICSGFTSKRGKTALWISLNSTWQSLLFAYHYCTLWVAIALGYGWLTHRIALGTNITWNFNEIHSVVFPCLRVNPRTDRVEMNHIVQCVVHGRRGLVEACYSSLESLDMCNGVCCARLRCVE